MKSRKLVVRGMLLFLIGLALPASGRADFAILHNFTGGTTDGENPNSFLVTDGTTLFGMTPAGGTKSQGVIFAISAAGGTNTLLHSFLDGPYPITSDGYEPEGGLTRSGSLFYGMTNGGGAYGSGTIFQIATNGSNGQILHSFNYSDGSSPVGNVILVGNFLYGMTGGGGKGPSGNGYGVLFQYDIALSQFTILHYFGDGTVPNDGTYPYGSLIMGSDGSTLYGMTEFGGKAGKGVVFQYSLGSNQLSILHHFGDGTVTNDGANPVGDLVQYGSTLYGMTESGGAGNRGVVFSTAINPGVSNPITTILHSFYTVTHDGSSPAGILTLMGNTLYGTTADGGLYNYGAAFQIGVDGNNYSVIHSFGDGTAQNYGAHPCGSLLLIGSTFYGMTYGSQTVNGVNGLGTIYSFGLPPAISSLYPTSGPPGARVTITGTNFGASQGSSVSFNGTAANATSWSNTQIVCSVPRKATSGNVTVTTSGGTSNGVAFKVLGAFCPSIQLLLLDGS